MSPRRKSSTSSTGTRARSAAPVHARHPACELVQHVAGAYRVHDRRWHVAGRERRHRDRRDRPAVRARHCPRALARASCRLTPDRYRSPASVPGRRRPRRRRVATGVQTRRRARTRGSARRARRRPPHPRRAPLPRPRHLPLARGHGQERHAARSDARPRRPRRRVPSLQLVGGTPATRRRPAIAPGSRASRWLAGSPAPMADGVASPTTSRAPPLTPTPSCAAAAHLRRAARRRSASPTSPEPSRSSRSRSPPPIQPSSTCGPRGIASVVWATGYRRDYSWLDVPVLDRDGELVQRARRDAGAGAVRRRAALPVAPQLELHRRCPPRCPRRRRSPRRRRRAGDSVSRRRV